VSNTDPYKLVNLPTELWDIGDVKPYPKNTKVHPKEHIKKLKASIEEQGLFDPIIVDYEGVIIAGHGRYEALTQLGQVKVPVKHARHLTKDQADAARIAHNKTASTEYDSEFMAEEIRRLAESTEVDVRALGLDEEEFDFLVEDLGEMNIDAISTDLDGDIDAQDEETQAKVAATDRSSEKVAKIFGFNSVPIAAVKHVRRFLADIEAETGLKGEEAFVEWVSARA
jgi:ParB-like nuclease domain